MTTTTARIFTSTESDAASSAPQNQILVNFRTTRGNDSEATTFLARGELNALRAGHREFFSKEEQAHAERVLTLLLSLEDAA